jgi:hypothetical protein
MIKGIAVTKAVTSMEIVLGTDGSSNFRKSGDKFRFFF